MVLISQFSRYLPLLKQLGCEIIFSCPSEMHHLFENISEIDEIDDAHGTRCCRFRVSTLSSILLILTPNIFEGCPQPVGNKH